MWAAYHSSPPLDTQRQHRFDHIQIKTFNKDNVSNSLMTKVKKYVNNPDFSSDNVSKVSNLSLPWRHRVPNKAI